MPDLSTFDDDIVDAAGYPTDDALDLIPAWTGTPRALVEDLLGPIFEAYGGIKVTQATDDFDRDVVVVRLVTGGWSGCESAIGALDDGLFWRAWWESSRRGGAYTFEVPAQAWDDTMIEWPKFDSAYERGWKAAATIATNAIDQARNTAGIPSQATAVLTAAGQALRDGPAAHGA